MGMIDLLSKIGGLLASCVGLVGLFLAVLQWRKSVCLGKAEYIRNLVDTFRVDSNIMFILYILDYGDKWYNEKFHNSERYYDFEAKVDSALNFFSYICYLKTKGILDKEDFFFFKYEVERILMNSQVQDYLYNLYHFAIKCETSMTFYFLFEYGRKERIFPEAFYDVESWRRTDSVFHRYLNF